MVVRLIFLLMLGLVIAAFSLPLLHTDQADASVSAEALRRLKIQAVLPYGGLHPRSLQVTEAHMTGPTPDHIEETVVFRSLFGLPVGTVVIQSQDYHLNFDPDAWFGLWFGFVALEVTLGTYALWRAMRE